MPDPTVLAPLLQLYGGDPSIDAHRRAHYAGMHAKSAANEAEINWNVYDEAYVASVGVVPADLAEASALLGSTRTPALWRWPIPETTAALAMLAAAAVPLGVVSNATGQIEATLNRSICQVGPGDFVEMRCIIDSGVVGIEKPDPAIFEHALPFFEEFERARIAYVGDSVTMDIAASTAAGLHPILIDPFDDHAGASFERVESVVELANELS